MTVENRNKTVCLNCKWKQEIRVSEKFGCLMCCCKFSNHYYHILGVLHTACSFFTETED